MKMTACQVRCDDLSYGGWGTDITEKPAASIMVIIVMTETADVSSLLVHVYWTALRQTDRQTDTA